LANVNRRKSRVDDAVRALSSDVSEACCLMRRTATEKHNVPLLPADRHFDPEVRRAMEVAFERARTTLRLGEVSDSITQIVAEKIIELAQAGERDPNNLCERTLSFLREQRAEKRKRAPCRIRRVPPLIVRRPD
jgi:hypothetical protein